MQRLSSDTTVFSKRIFPAISAGVMVLVILGGILGKVRSPGFFIAPLLGLPIGYAFWRLPLSELADEVTDYGAYLLVRLGATQDRIALSNIKDVELRRNSRPPVMTVRLVQPCLFGESVSFIPFSGLPFAGLGKGKLPEMLLRRADAARREGQ